jgi:hypothetical protein
VNDDGTALVDDATAFVKAVADELADQLKRAASGPKGEHVSDCDQIHQRLAEVAYQAYGDAVSWRNFIGAPMPTWQDLPDDTRTAWVAAAAAVAAHLADPAPAQEPPAPGEDGQG